MRKSRIILVMLVVAVCNLAYGQNLSQKREQRSRLERDIAILQQQLSGNESKSTQALSTISVIQAQQQSRKQLIKQSDSEIADLDGQISVINAEVMRKQEVLDTLQAHYSRLIMGAYKNRDIKLWYMYILASENISQAFRRFGYFKNLSAQLAVQARKIEDAKAELNAQKDKLRQARSQAASLRNQRSRELDKLKSEEASQKRLVDKFKKDKKAYQASLRSKQAEMRAIDKQIAKMLEEATGKGKTSGSASKPKKQVDYTLDKNFEKNKGKLPWPVDGPVVDHYGAYQNKELRLSLFNNGINIACESGSLVRSVFDGVVSNVMLAPGYGQCILVQHGGYYTSYCKVKNATVRQGDKVSTGQILGEVSTIMGKTQLYFLVFKKSYLDPEIWLRER